MNSDSLGCSLIVVGPHNQMAAGPYLAIVHWTQGMCWKSSRLAFQVFTGLIILKGWLLKLANLVMALVESKNASKN